MGALLLADRPGLRVEYFALTPSWDARPVFTAVGEPQLGRAFRHSGLDPFLYLLMLIVVHSRARDLAVQRGDLILYPWRVFEDELRRDRPQSIALSPDLYRRYGMVGRQGARQIVARLFLGREDLRVWQSRTLTPGTERAIASRRDLEAWNGRLPGLDALRPDPPGTAARGEPLGVTSGAVGPPTRSRARGDREAPPPAGSGTAAW